MARRSDRMLLLDSKVERPVVDDLQRPRLDRQLDLVWDRGLAVVTGAAGWGKSTLLSQFAARSAAPVAWYRADATDSSADDLVAYILHAVRHALDRDLPQCDTPEELAATIGAAAPPAGLAVVIDDVHDLASSEAGNALGRFTDSLPGRIAVVLAGRAAPEFELARRRVSGRLVEIGPDDLRFRTWEVESLFRDLYRDRLRPEEIATLSARLEGWAAGLRLFHLATTGKPPSARRATLASFGARRDMCREYLTQNVLHCLPASEYELLIRTSVLGVLSAPMCDEFLGGTAAESTLAQIEQRGLITFTHDARGSYRCHEVLRAHFESLLLTEIGDEAMRREYGLAAELLARHGWSAEAVRAYCRSGDVESAAELLGFQGSDVADERSSWWESIPAALLDSDPWILLARARRAVSAGDLSDAILHYRSARLHAGEAAPGPVCAQEQRAVEDWEGRALIAAPGWTGLVRTAMQRSPLRALARTTIEDDPGWRLGEGLALLLAGRSREARLAFDRVIEHRDCSDLLATVAHCATAFVDVLQGENDPAKFDLLAREADLLDQFHLARVAASLASAAAGGEGAGRLPPWPASVSDQWVMALSLCALGLRRPSNRDALAELVERQGEAAAWLSSVDARSLECWLRSLRAVGLVELGDPRAEGEAAEAEVLARSSGIPGARAFAIAALRVLESTPIPSLETTELELGSTCGIDPRCLAPRRLFTDGHPAAGPMPPSPSAKSISGSSAFQMQCLGSLVVTIDGSGIALESLRPKPRSLLRYLALREGQPVHREVLVDALWPSAGLDAGTHSLQVAVSSLRRVLVPDSVRGEAAYIERTGDSYRLAPPPGADIDLWRLRDELRQGRALARSGETAAAARTFREALADTSSELFPEEGVVEWIVTARAELTQELADASLQLAELLTHTGEHAEAINVCERGLRFDPYHDRLWRALVASAHSNGDHAMAAHAERRYHRVLDELDLVDTLVITSG